MSASHKNQEHISFICHRINNDRGDKFDKSLRCMETTSAVKQVPGISVMFLEFDEDAPCLNQHLTIS